MEVFKVLGDLFEVVVGVIYLDCGVDFERVWKIYLFIFKFLIGEYVDIFFIELYL